MDTYSELVADTAPAAGSTQPKPMLGSRPDRVRIPIAGLLERVQHAAAA
jgi:hypothetical protein